MKRLAVLLIAVSLVTAGIPMSGAFTSVSADRAVDVTVANDSDAFLALEPADGPNGAYAEQSEGMLSLHFDGTGTPAAGLNPDATTYAENVFVATNQGTQPVTLTVDDPAEGLEFYAEHDGVERRLDGENREGIQLGVGEKANVSVRLISSDGSSLEAVDEITITADADGAGEGSGSGDPSDGEDDGRDGDGTGSDGNETGGDGPGDNESVGGSVETSIDDGTLSATGNATAGESLTLNVGELPNATQDNGSVESLTINYVEDVEGLDTTVSLTGGGMERAPGDRPAPPNASVITYLNVSHPATPDAAIENASFRFVVPHEAGTNAGSVDLLRYDESAGAWETVSTQVSYVENSSAGYVYEARTETLSTFALVEAIRGLYVQTDEAVAPLDASITTDPNTTYPVTAYETYHETAFNEAYWKENATEDADDAAAVIREELRVDLKESAKDAAIDKAIALVDGVLKTTVGLSGVGTALMAMDVALKSDEFASSYGPAIQKQAVAIHVDPETDSYDDLRANLQALEENSAAYKQAVRENDVERQNQLLRERETLLQETYHLLPRYTEDVHEDVVNNAAGLEDPQAYEIIRSNVESLRLLVKLDYEETTRELYGAPERSLARDTSMPTHGWTAFGNAFVYDTMDHGDDYVVLELDASQAVKQGENMHLTVTGSNVTAFDTELVTDRPDDPRTVEGRSLESAGLAKLSETVEDPAETSYLVIRADGATGPLKVRTKGGTTLVNMSVVERAGPDIQRPHAELVTGPDPVTLADGDAVYPTNDSDTDLVWELWDAKTETADIEYRFRVDDGTGFDDWSAWQTAPADGRVTPDLTYGDGLTRVQLHVRDDVGRTTVRNADVVLTTGPPQTAVAAPFPDDPTSGEVFVRVLPDRRIESVELQYRPVGNDTWRKWRTVNDTEGFGQLTAPAKGEVVVRARATNLAGQTGDWATETLVHDEPPEIKPAGIPSPKRTLIDGEKVERRVVANETPTLGWVAEDDEMPNDDLEYRYQVGDGPWSDWETTDEGHFEVAPTVSTAGTTVSVQVRDEANNVASRSVTVYWDNDDPKISVTANDGVTGARVDVNASEPLSAVELQYRAEGEEEWTHWVTDPYLPTVSLDEAGDYELRARGIDTVGNAGPWTGPEPFTSLPEERSTPISEDPITVSGGESVEYGVPDGGDFAEATLQYNALVEEIDGELLLDLYMLSREGKQIHISSITFTEDGNQTVSEDLPGNLTDDSRLQVDVKGNGTVVLSSFRAISAAPDVPRLAVEPTNATVGTPITISPRADWSGDSTIENFEWDVDGDGAFERTSDNATTTVAYESSGNRTVTLRATDLFGATATSETTIHVNAPPTAAIEAESPVKTAASLSITGAVSVDTDGEIVTYDWDIEAAADGSDANITRSFADDGIYAITLTVTDDDGASDTTTANVTVENRAPIAVGAVTSGRPVVGEPVSFSASDSSDPDGSVVETHWDLDGDGEFETDGETPSAVFDDYGPRTATLQVIDDDGATNETEIRFDVNAPPEPRISTDAPALTGESITLDASDSVDPDGDIVTYDWETAGDGTQTDEPVASVSFPDDATYPITLTVTDDDGTSRTVTKNVTVENRRPSAVGSVNDTEPTIGEAVAFDATDSIDPDGTVTTATWDLDADGDNERDGMETVATFDDPGEHTAHLRVVDDDGATNETTVTVDVNAPPEPKLNVTDSVLTGESLALDASASTDPDGDIVKYDWDVEGATNETGSVVNQSFADDGTYRIRLTVVDDDGASATRTTNVTVENRPPELWLTRLSPESTPVQTYEPVEYGVDTLDGDGETGNVTLSFTAPSGLTRTMTLDGTATVRFNESGNWTVSASVVDDDGAGTTVNRTIAVNAPPTVDIDAPSETVTGDQVTLSADTFDRDGSVVNYSWVIDDRNYQTENVTITPETPGDMFVTLRVVDDDGATAVANTTITVEEALDADLYVDKLLGGRILSSSVYVYDSNGSVEDLSYAWDLDGDGSFDDGVGQFRDKVVDGPGEYPIAVRVEGADGSTTVENETVTVESLSENLSIDWRYEDGGGQVAETEPAVYVGEGEEQTGDNWNESTVRAISRGNGSEIWSSTVSFGAHETVVRDEAVYSVGSGIAQLDPDTGDVSWTWSNNEYGDAVFENDRAYMAANRTVVALNTSTGAVIWNGTDRESIDQQTVSSDVLVTSSTDWDDGQTTTTIVARDIEDGSIRWNVTRNEWLQLEGGVDSRILVTADGNLTAYEADTGERVWSQQLPDEAAEHDYVEGVTVKDGTIYADGGGYSDHWLVALSPAGERLWSESTQDVRSVRFINNTLLLAHEGGVTAYDRTNGTTVWNRTLPASYPYLQTDGHDGFVAYDYPGQGVILDGRTGEVEWNGAVGDLHYQSEYRNGTLYIGTGDSVYAVRLTG